MYKNGIFHVINDIKFTEKFSKLTNTENSNMDVTRAQNTSYLNDICVFNNI